MARDLFDVRGDSDWSDAFQLYAAFLAPAEELSCRLGVGQPQLPTHPELLAHSGSQDLECGDSSCDEIELHRAGGRGVFRPGGRKAVQGGGLCREVAQPSRH